MIATLLLRILPFWRPIAIGVVVVLFIIGVYAKGRNDSTKVWKAKEVARQLEEARRRVKLQADVDALADKLEKARTQREVVTRTITKEIPFYVKEPPEACVDTGLSAPGFRVLHDAAAAGKPPDPASVATATPVPAETAARTITENYAGCNLTADQVEGWQAFWSAYTRSKQP